MSRTEFGMALPRGIRVLLIVLAFIGWLIGNLLAAFSENLNLWISVFALPFAVLFGALFGECLAK